MGTPVCRVITDTPLAFLVWRREYDDFVCGMLVKEDFRLTAWNPEAWRATKFTEQQAIFVAALLRAEVCPLFDRGDRYEVLFSEDGQDAQYVWTGSDVFEEAFF